jgi:hypothetical protein
MNDAVDLHMRRDSAIKPPRRWPCWLAFFTAPWAPKTTAERTNETRIFPANSLSVISILIAVGSLKAYDATWVHVESAGTSIQERFLNFTVWTLASIAGAVAVSVASAWILMAWGARDEHLRSTFRHALRRVCVQSPHFAWAVLFSLSVMSIREISHTKWTVDISVRAGEIYSETVAQSRQFNRSRYDTARKIARTEIGTPWWIGYRGAIDEALFGISILWIVWGLFRATGAPRPDENSSRPPTCEWCGYDLTGASLDGKCPECGTGVHDSLDDSVRRGAPWERRREIGHIKAFAISTVDPVLHPESIGRRLEVWSGSRDYRSFFKIYLAVIFVSVTVEQGVEALASDNWSINSYDAWRWLWFTGPGAAAYTALGTAMFVTLTAGLFGGLYSARYQRNVTSGFMQAASYLCGHLAIGAVLISASTIYCLVMGVPEWLSDWASLVGMRPDKMAMLIQGAFGLTWLALFLFALSRIGVGIRYANR